MALAYGSTEGAFIAQTSNTGSMLTAVQLDAYLPTAVASARTAATTCLVSWTPHPATPAPVTYDVLDGSGNALAVGVSGTSHSVSAPAAAFTPWVRVRVGTWLSTSWASAAATCTGYPDAPSATVTPSDGQISAAWPAPADNGSSITSYTATTSPPSTTCTVMVPAAQSCTFAGLTNGITYTASVTATNGVGTGPPGIATATAYPSLIMTAARLKLWLDGAEPTTILASSACTGASATTTVGCWKDKSPRPTTPQEDKDGC